MKNLIQRAAEPADVVGRTLEGVALRYERPSRVTDDNWKTSYYEEYLRRSTAKSLQDGGAWGLNRMHQKDDVLGTVEFHNSDAEDALLFRAVIDQGPEGDLLLADVESGDWRDVSIGARVLRSAQRMAAFGPVTVRQEIALDHLAVAMTGSGLMAGAEVTALRAATEGTPRLDVLRKKLILLR